MIVERLAEPASDLVRGRRAGRRGGARLHVGGSDPRDASRAGDGLTDGREVLVRVSAAHDDETGTRALSPVQCGCLRGRGGHERRDGCPRCLRVGASLDHYTIFAGQRFTNSTYRSDFLLLSCHLPANSGWTIAVVASICDGILPQRRIGIEAAMVKAVYDIK